MSAKLCARFVTHLFACPEYPPTAAGQPPPTAQPVHLAAFVAYALHRTRLHQSVTFAALYLLQRLKQRFPAARGSSGHRLFLSAFMIASKVICDDTYSNKSWCIVGQGMFALREVNQMEREMCAYLDWELNVDPDCLREFERAVRGNFTGPGPYKPIPLPLPPSKTAAAPVAPAPYTAPPEQATITVGTPTVPPSTRHTSPSHRYSPESPDTPGSSRSMGSSPASSPGPRTPESIEEAHAKIAAAQQSPPYGPNEPRPSAAGIKAAAMAAALQREPGAPPHVGVVSADVPSKPQPQRSATGKTFLLPGKNRSEAFAFANPAHW
jgi:hypothetical protein